MKKDIIFYSNYCTYSKEIINQISKTSINDNIIYVCVDDENIQLPPFIKAVPTIYLVNDKKISSNSMKRLKVIEKNTDGFIISEEDLKVRGEGNLFGSEQSGTNQFRKIANIVDHCDILLNVKEDFPRIASNNNPLYRPYIDYLSQDERIFTTI